MAYKTGNGTAIHFFKKSINQGLYQDSFRCWNDFIFISVSFNKGVKSNTWLTVENKNNILDNLSILFYRILDLEVQCCRFRKGCDLQPNRAHWQPHALWTGSVFYPEGFFWRLYKTTLCKSPSRSSAPSDSDHRLQSRSSCFKVKVFSILERS